METTKNIIMPSKPSITSPADIQWNSLLCGAIKTNYRCAECTKPIDNIGFCSICLKKANNEKS